MRLGKAVGSPCSIFSSHGKAESRWMSIGRGGSLTVEEVPNKRPLLFYGLGTKGGEDKC